MKESIGKNGFSSCEEVSDFGCSFKMHIHPRAELVSDIIRERGRYSHNDLVIMRTLIREGDFVIDIGANIGWYTLFFSSFAGSAGSVLAIEPEHGNLALLRRNIRKNSIGNVDVFSGALSDVAGKGQLFRSQENSGDHILNVSGEMSSREQISVTVGTLDSVIEKQGKGMIPTFIKMDVQGSEPKVLRGARKLFETHKPTVMIEYSPRHMHDCGSSGFEIFAFIESHGYIPFRQLGDGEELSGGRLLELLSPATLLRYHESLMVSGLGIDILLISRERIPEIASYVYNFG